MAYCAAYSDPAIDVQRTAGEFVNCSLLGRRGWEEEADKVRSSSQSSSSSSRRRIVASVCRYAIYILQCRNAQELQDYIEYKTRSSVSTAATTTTTTTTTTTAIQHPRHSTPNTSSNRVLATAEGSGKRNKKKGKNSDDGGKSNIDIGTPPPGGGDVDERIIMMKDERYVRIIQTTIIGLGHVFDTTSTNNNNDNDNNKGHNISHDDDDDDDDDSVVIDEYLPILSTLLTRRLLLSSSSRSIFRRSCYIVVGKICQHYYSNDNISLLSYLSLGKVIPELLSTEKESYNIVPLLEMILSYLSVMKCKDDSNNNDNGGSGSSSSSSPWRNDDACYDNSMTTATTTTTTTASNTTSSTTIDATIFVKSLSKMLRRGCYGATVVDWGPAILPIVASLPISSSSSSSSTTLLPPGSDDGYQEQKNEQKGQKGETVRPLAIAVVASLWDGRKCITGTADTIALLAAMAECVTYLLLRRNNSSNNGNNDHCHIATRSWEECGRLFLDTISYYLTELSKSSRSIAGMDGLCTTLASNLYKLDTVSSSLSSHNLVDDDRGITVVKSWLWGDEGLMQYATTTLSSSSDSIPKWNSLLRRLIRLQVDNNGESIRSVDTISNLTPACKVLFHNILHGILLPNRITNKSCNLDEGNLLLSILQCCGVGNIFVNATPQSSVLASVGSEEENCTTTTIEHFCVNDLLRWILIHSSSHLLSLIDIDFELLKLCLHAIPSLIRQKQIWEVILSELIKCYCDYATLSVGLEVMVKNDSAAAVALVKCDMLDVFATETAEQVMNTFRRSQEILNEHDELEGEDDTSISRQGDVLCFLQTCVGMSSTVKNYSGVLIVSTSVIRHWIDLCCQQSRANKSLTDGLILEDEKGDNILLKTLLDLSSSSQNIISHEETVKLVYESMFEGGPTWKGPNVAQCLTHESISSETVRDHVITIATTSLYDDIHSDPPSDCALVELICHAWANRAARLFHIHPVADLVSLGLGRIELWNKSVGGNKTDFLFLCLMYLLHTFDQTELRRELLFKVSGVELFAHILICISNDYRPHTDKFRGRSTRNLDLVEALGDRNSLSMTLLEEVSAYTIDFLHGMMKGDVSSDEMLINCALTSLSFLMTLLFPPQCPDNDTDTNVIAANVKEGDYLWYEKGELRNRVKVTVLKIHRDDFPNLYFTIKEEGSNQEEKQTVADRLKWNAGNTGTNNKSTSDRRQILDSNNGDTAKQRETIGRRTVDNLIQPYLSAVRLDDDAHSKIKSSVAAESVNIVVSQCGFVSHGIGSVRYDIIQAVSAIERDLCDALSGSDPNLAKSISLLRFLSLAMGYSSYSAPSEENITILKLDTSGSIQCLLDMYENVAWLEAQPSSQRNSFHSYALIWLAVSLSTIKDGELLRRTATMMHCISSFLLTSDARNLAINSLHVMNAMRYHQLSSASCIDYSSSDSVAEKSVISNLIGSFVKISEVNDSWIEEFTHLLQRNCSASPSLLLPATHAFLNEICDCLYDSRKRWCAFHLMHLFAKDTKPLQSGDDSIIIPTESEEQLLVWKKALDEDDAIELEEDLVVTASWLPGRIMSLLQKMGNGFNGVDDPQVLATGDLLAWVITLEILDVAGSADTRNRSHISSFIHKTESLGHIMKLALNEADLDVGRNEDIFACVDMDCSDDFLIEQLAMLVVFRTVESLPTLVKTWYNDDCPHFLKQRLSSFVENTVAPRTLQRQLLKIKNATSSGEMTVSGSCVSREIIATYQQDECQLSVMIRMPSTFPLRNVEVDLGKTMGIPESRWRRWALQIMLMLNSQDGSILDALLLWKQNVDKEFEGVEPCPVCYSVICIKTHQMPNLDCTTCHNRFHTQCLMKWFQSSGKSMCVICQQPWQGTRVHPN